MTVKTPSAALRGLGPAVGRRWTTHRSQHAQRQLWAQTASFADLCELTAQWCEGKVGFTPSHQGPPEPETTPVCEVLAHANRAAFLTVASQPGGDAENGYQQRAAVQGFIPVRLIMPLARVIRGTRLVLQLDEICRWRTDYSRAVVVTREVPSGSAVTTFGWAPSKHALTELFNGIGDDAWDELITTKPVMIYDPKWGNNDLLWERLMSL